MAAMNKRIPIKAAKAFAFAQGQRLVVIFAWDGECNHLVTYGKTIEDCSRAADFGNRLKTTLGWPQSLMSQPARVRKLEDRVQELEAKLAKSEERLR